MRQIFSDQLRYVDSVGVKNEGLDPRLPNKPMAVNTARLRRCAACDMLHFQRKACDMLHFQRKN